MTMIKFNWYYDCNYELYSLKYPDGIVYSEISRGIIHFIISGELFNLIYPEEIVHYEMSRRNCST